MSNISLLGSTSRVSVPFIKVTFGDLNSGYTFGVYNRVEGNHLDENGFFRSAHINYPNYVQSLDIVKINGQVNQYTLKLTYPIRNGDDPNFFEKIFSSVSSTRKIYFSYGDCNLPTFIYKDEEAIITKVTSDFDIKSSKIGYIISATSSATLANSGSYTFVGNEWSGYQKPSLLIRKLISNKYYGLQDLFVGMNNIELVESKDLIPSDDKGVYVQGKTNISALDYLNYLVECMRPANSTNSNQTSFYALKIIDDINEINNELGGTYFKIELIDSKKDHSDAYEIEIGYPTANIVTSFSINDNENYSLYYNWQKELNNEQYVERLNDNGEWETIYAPVISSKNPNYRTMESDSTWWSKVTEYPINATIKIKGLLRPAILMSYVRLKVYFFGSEHISSGLYLVTKQQDSISSSGFYSTLSLTRVAGAD